MAADPTIDTVLAGYAADGPTLVARFEAISSADLYAPVQEILPTRPAFVADIGAGTGRDAAWLSAKGHRLVAVEPVAELREAGMRLHAGSGIEWIDDRLPELHRMAQFRASFDRVLLSGVWQHLQGHARATAMARLASLLAPEGALLMSLRHGPGAVSRPCFEASTEEAIGFGALAGLQPVFSRRTGSTRAANRAAGVSWTWLAFRPAG